jgi:DNA-binding IclR family transcriptional regulator
MNGATVGEILLGQRARQAAWLGAFGSLHDECFYLLLSLYRSGAKGLTAAELATEQSMPKATLGRYLDLLESRGFVESNKEPSNNWPIKLSSSAQVTIAQMLNDLHEVLASLPKPY